MCNEFMNHSSRVPSPSCGRRPLERRLRSGFSTGTAVAAAARAALRFLLTGNAPTVVAVRLPIGYYLPVPIRESQLLRGVATAVTVKDAGDDPDVTHKAELRTSVRLVSLRRSAVAPDAHPCRLHFPDTPGELAGIRIIGGKGVGRATKPGIPVRVGEPAVNPTPREMLLQNLMQEYLSHGGHLSDSELESLTSAARCAGGASEPHIFLPFPSGDRILSNVLIEVEIEVPRGTELALRTLNPRLGIVGGISILGTTGLVKPFSHEAYEETIQAALSVAAASGCREAVLSTGGKSERLAGGILESFPSESFVQIADFFAFALGETRKMAFERVVLSAFFGKVVKMAQGHPYTHAHTTPLDLNPVARIAHEAGFGKIFCQELASANTARHALELLLAQGASGVIRTIAEFAAGEAARFSGYGPSIRLLLFDYDGSLLVDLERPC